MGLSRPEKSQSPTRNLNQACLRQNAIALPLVPPTLQQKLKMVFDEGNCLFLIVNKKPVTLANVIQSTRKSETLLVLRAPKVCGSIIPRNILSQGVLKLTPTLPLRNVYSLQLPEFPRDFHWNIIQDVWRLISANKLGTGLSSLVSTMAVKSSLLVISSNQDICKSLRGNQSLSEFASD